MTDAQETHRPSPLSTWLAEFTRRRTAIAESVSNFVALLGQIPDPQSAEDVQTLLRWRAQFRLPDEPAGTASINAAVDEAARPVREQLYPIAEAMQRLLENIENVLAYDASDNRYGLFSPAACPRQKVIVTNGQAILTTLSALPPDHPLCVALKPDNRLPWIPLGRAEVCYRMNGDQIYSLPCWRTVASIVQEVEERHKRKDEEDRQAAEVAAWQLRRDEAEAAARQGPEEFMSRRMAAVEEELDRLRRQDRQPVTPF